MHAPDTKREFALSRSADRDRTAVEEEVEGKTWMNEGERERKRMYVCVSVRRRSCKNTGRDAARRATMTTTTTRDGPMAAKEGVERG